MGREETYICGRYANAKIFTTHIENDCLQQIQKLIDSPLADRAVVRVMPDCHLGKGCTVGLTMKLNTMSITPTLVGVDIGCGMAWQEIKSDISLKDLDEAIHAVVPSGHNIGTIPYETNALFLLHTPLSLEEQTYMRCSLGTLGGGNHFIELDESQETGKRYLVVHSGSRKLGVKVCNYWQKRATYHYNKELRQRIIDALKEKHQEQQIEQALKEFSVKEQAERAFPMLGTTSYFAYLRDSKLCTEFARENREHILRNIVQALHPNKWNLDDCTAPITHCIHNYISDHHIVRKGAIAAYSNTPMLIPLNMRDGMLFGYGKGNANWNCSGPHGAGRVMSRTQAKATLKMENYVKSMEGIYSSTICPNTIDEAPAVYKQGIEELIEDTMDVHEHWKPLYNFKATEGAYEHGQNASGHDQQEGSL